MKELNKNYNPKDFEERIYREWSEGDYFKADAQSKKPPYSMVMPPPNVTGNLHLGHAINNTLQDVLIRQKRMQGYEVLWIPGTDHASIATEAKVVDKLAKEGIAKEDLGRENFLKEAWDWTDKYGGNIKNQLKKLGVSCDWSRERFTLDEDVSKAVLESFVQFYERGYIYRGDRIVNWCPSCQTAISDIEVEHIDEKGKLYHIEYKVKDSDESIIIATTRPETLLGDLAVAVNPEDERYKDFIGKTLILPLVDREIPIIEDDYVESEFGSGAVKITPSHDPNDFEVGARHELGQCVVIDEKGYIVEGYGKYSALERYEARKQIIKDLEDLNQLVKIEEHDHAVGHCDRCDAVIEPLISKQWFVSMKELAKPAKEAYLNGDLKFYPDRFGKTYLNWLDNIRDWCISRQLWWGHRIPAYECQDCKEIIVSKEAPKECTKCNSKNVKQFEDTLDTWFSSGLWPFSTLGWPDNSKDFEKFFPTIVLVTGYDIIFFWIIRMVFMSVEMTGQLPFKDVYLNGLVRDQEGRKMSKSLGNGIDPLEVIEEYGADALRFMLVTGNTPGNDMRFFLEKVESSRNFANKLWNASRFVLMHLDEDSSDSLEDLELESSDKWILSNLQYLIENMNINLSKYELGIAASNLYNFVWDEFCDWYIELVKDRLFKGSESSKAAAKAVLLFTLKNILKLLHPFMPFITEEIYSFLPSIDGKIIDSAWPTFNDELIFEKEKSEIEIMIDAITGIRNARSEAEIAPSKKAELYVHADELHRQVFENNDQFFTSLASTSEVKYLDSKFDGEALTIVKSGYELFIPLSGLIDYEKELDRIEKEKNKAEEELERAKRQLSNEGFVKNAPSQVVEIEKEKLQKFEILIKELEASIESIKAKLK